MKVYKASLRFESQLVLEDSLTGTLTDSPGKIFKLMENQAEKEGDPTVEYFWCLVLNRKNRILSVVTITKGTATASLCHPREVLKPVIVGSGSAFVCVHNHPSGDPTPSQADIHSTRQLRKAAETMQLSFLDHIIVGSKNEDPAGSGYYSFAEAGLL